MRVGKGGIDKQTGLRTTKRERTPCISFKWGIVYGCNVNR